MTTTLSAEPALAATSGPIMMTTDEARACVAEIKRLTEDLGERLLDLHNREGWRALGYKTWKECVQHEFHMSRVHAHRLINAAMVDRFLALPVGNVQKLPERQKRELVPLLDQPEKIQAAVEDAVVVAESAGETLTTNHVRDAADRQLGRERPRPVISSKADAGDFADDAPDYAEQSQETYGDAPNAEKWCADCGGTYRGKACPCTAEAPDLRDPWPHGTKVVVTKNGERAEGSYLTIKDFGDEALLGISIEKTRIGNGIPDGMFWATRDQVEAAGSVDAQLAEVSAELDAILAEEDDAPLTGRGRSEARDDASPIESTATDDGSLTPPSTPAPPASSSTHASQQPDRPLTEPKGKSGGSHTSTVRVFSAPTLDAGDLARSLLDFPTADVLEAITENATPAQLAAIRAAIGGPVQATASIAQRVTLKDVKALIRDLTATEIRLLESELPMLRKEAGARERAAVNGVAV